MIARSAMAISGTPLWPVVEADEFLTGVVRLFAARPDLPQKIIDKLARDKVAGQATALFDYLFVGATRPALGTEDYFYAGYRVLRPEEIDAALGALDPGEKVENSHGP